MVTHHPRALVGEYYLGGSAISEELLAVIRDTFIERPDVLGDPLYFFDGQLGGLGPGLNCLADGCL